MTNFKLTAKQTQHLKSLYTYCFQWACLSIAIGVFVGLASALFLVSLNYVTVTRETHTYLLYFLPIAGLLTGLLYHYYGTGVRQGIKLLLVEYKEPQHTIPLKMAPMVLIGTLLTHLFGGSAGREGTALQMGGAIADQFYRFVKPSKITRQTILLMGISAGFGSVFGTPLAGTLFAFELMRLKKIPYQAIIPTLFAALIANQTCVYLGITHHIYTVTSFPSVEALLLLKVGLLGIACGLVAIAFVKCTDTIAYITTKVPIQKLYIPFWGAIVFVVLILLIGDPRYLGLGIDTISESFTKAQPITIFVLKLLFTAITLGVGFKGGEVTPLFFIGAALGSFLSYYLHIDISFAAALGFIAVFVGATKTPLACIVMGIELFGLALTPYLIVVCFVAYFISGKHTIYN